MKSVAFLIFLQTILHPKIHPVMQRYIRLIGCLLLCASFTACTQSGSTNSSVTDTTTDDEQSGFPPGTFVKGKMINWYARPGNAWLLKGSNEDCYLYVHVRSGQAPGEQRRIPLNISLVLDRSGSMAGDKIDYARRAAKFLVDQLSADDYLSLVNYDDVVELTSPSQPVKNKEALKHAIDRISDRGLTNLSGGMLEGYTQVKSTHKPGYVNRVLIMTDGLANQGITEPHELKGLVEKKYKEDGIALSTFGLGADYNEDLLTMLAETGRANYYFIDSADKIPQLFARELKGLLSVVAQNALVQINIPEGMECEKVYGYPFDVKDNQVYVRFNDIYANEEKAILLKLRAKEPLSETLHFDCKLGYTSTQDFKQVNDSRQITVKVTSDKALVEKGQDSTVQEMLALFESTEQFDEIMAQVDKGAYDTAKSSGAVALDALKQKQAQYKSRKLEEQVKKMSSYLTNIDSVKVMQETDKKLFQKSAKSINYEVKKQRSKKD